LEKAGRPERVDHRSLKDQGIDRIPEPKIGVAATAMKRRGILEDPDRFRLVRWVKSLNEVRPQMRDIQGPGEIRQFGAGKTWWEKSIIFMSRVRQATRETVLDTWHRLIDSRKTREHGHLPPLGRGPENSR
jgi:MobA/MobL family protein